MSWPEEHFAISFSGGRTSGMMLIKLLEENGPLPDHGWAVFQNTSREHEATYEFIERIQDFCGNYIIWLEFHQTQSRKPGFRAVDFATAKRDGSVFENAVNFGEGGWLPNSVRRSCSRKMKRQTMERFLKSKGAKVWANYVGIRADEARRANPAPDSRVNRIFPLVEWGKTKEDVIEFWKKMPFDLGLDITDKGTLYGNCTGCFLKSELHLATLCRERPDEFAWWEKMEERHGSTFKTGVSYKDIRKKVEKGDSVFDLEDYFCQADGGECTGE